MGAFDDAEEKLCPCALARVFSSGMGSSRCSRRTQLGSALHVGTALAPPDGAASGSGVAAWAKVSWLEEAPGVTTLSYYYFIFMTIIVIIIILSLIIMVPIRAGTTSFTSSA